MPRTVEVKTASRLHFGLTTLGHGAGRQFGGVGVMVDTEGVALRLTAADQFQVNGFCGDRVKQIAHQFTKAQQLAALPGVKKGSELFSNRSDPFSCLDVKPA